MAMETQLLPVRKTLTEKYGIGNERIGYDTTSGYVTVDNQKLFKPPTNTAGTTYAGQDVFNSAGGQINTLNNAYKIQQNQVTNQNTGNQLLQQITTPQANSWDEPYKTNYDAFSELVKNPKPVDMASLYASPEYAAQKAQQDRAAQQSTRIAQESLGDSGFSQSTRLSDRAQGIQNDANAYLETQTVPQLIAAQKQEQQAQLNNLMGLLSTISQAQTREDTLGQNKFGNTLQLLQRNDLQDQRGIENNNADRTFNSNEKQMGIENTRAEAAAKLNETQIMAALTGFMPDGTPTSAQQQQQLSNEWAVAEQTGAITQTLAKLYNIPVGTPTRAAKEFAQQLAISQQNANTASYSAETSRKNQEIGNTLAQDRFDWEKEQALAKGNPEMEQEIEGLYTGLSTGQISPSAASAEIDQRLKAGLMTNDEAVQMKSFIQKYAESIATKTDQTGPKTQVTNNSKLFTMDNNELEKAWETDPTGQKAGRAMYDWMRWIRDDKNGYKSGATYEIWKDQYGPSIG